MEKYAKWRTKVTTTIFSTDSFVPLALRAASDGADETTESKERSRLLKVYEFNKAAVSLVTDEGSGEFVHEETWLKGDLIRKNISHFPAADQSICRLKC